MSVKGRNKNHLPYSFIKDKIQGRIQLSQVEGEGSLRNCHAQEPGTNGLPKTYTEPGQQRMPQTGKIRI